MTISYRSLFIVTFLIVILHCDLTFARNSIAVGDTDDLGVSVLSWNMAHHEAPFLPLTRKAGSNFAGQMLYPSGDFAFPFLQSLSYDSDCDCHSLIVSKRPGVLEVVHFWRARSDFYRTANGPYLELENVDSLKAVTALNGTRFLFAQVGDGEWRCVSIHDPAGSYVLIDYRADGLIERLRDSLSRTAVPEYEEGRMVSLTQTWTTRSGQSKRSVISQ